MIGPDGGEELSGERDSLWPALLSIDKRPATSGHEARGPLFEELQRLEDQVAGAVGPRGLERQSDATIPGKSETVLGHGGAQ